MAIYFLDTSALAKRYILETGTQWVQSLFASSNAHRLTISIITGAELVAAISRRHRGGAMSATQANQVISHFRASFAIDFQVIEITSSLIDTAMELAQRRGLRGYDSVQLATALAFNAIARPLQTPVTFVSADAELNAAAIAEGLVVESPDSHP